MAMKHGPFEDVFPIEHGDFPARHVSLTECSRKAGIIGDVLGIFNHQSTTKSESGEIDKIHVQ